MLRVSDIFIFLLLLKASGGMIGPTIAVAPATPDQVPQRNGIYRKVQPLVVRYGPAAHSQLSTNIIAAEHSIESTRTHGLTPRSSPRSGASLLVTTFERSAFDLAGTPGSSRSSMTVDGRQYAFDMMPESGHTGVAHVAAETI